MQTLLLNTSNNFFKNGGKISRILRLRNIPKCRQDSKYRDVHDSSVYNSEIVGSILNSQQSRKYRFIPYNGKYG